MMKFFRKHNKKLMAVLMALLMVVFIGGSALQGMLTPSRNAVVAKSRFGEITEQDQLEITRLTRLMGSMNLTWQQPIPLNVAVEPLQEIDWILLRRETEELGMMMSRAHVRASANTEQVRESARILRVKAAELIEARTVFDAVRRTALTLAQAAAPSEAMVRARTRDVLEPLQVNAVVVPAKMFVDRNQTFPEDELQAQFEKYKAKEAGEGLDFGYYRRPRVKVRFVEVDRDKLAESIGIANLEGRARALYSDMVVRQDPLIKRPQEQLDAADEGPAPSPVLSWEEAKEKVVAAVRRKQADEMARRIAGWLIQKDNNLWLDGTRKENGYFPAPEGVSDRDHYRKLIDRLPREINYPEAVTVWDSNFFTQADAGDVAKIGYAQYEPLRGASIPFGRLAFLTESMVPEVPEDAANRTDYIATYQTSPYPLTDPIRGHMFVFRVIDSKQGRPAESLDEVRDEVVADLRLLQAFKEAEARAESLRSCAVGEGLQEAYDTNLELVDLRDTPEGINSGFFQPPAFSRLRSYEAATGRSPQGTFVGGGLGSLPNWAVDECFALENKFDRVTVLPLRNRADVIVVELLQVNPPVYEDFIETREQVLQQMQAEQWRLVFSNWLDPEQIRARNGLELVSRGS